MTTPNEIKEAAEKTYPTDALTTALNNLQFLDGKEERDLMIGALQNAFEIGALHPATEEYYKTTTLLFLDWIRVNKIKVHPVKQLWFFEDLSSLDIPNYYTADDLFNLYKQSQTKNQP